MFTLPSVRGGVAPHDVILSRRVSATKNPSFFAGRKLIQTDTRTVVPQLALADVYCRYGKQIQNFRWRCSLQYAADQEN